MPGKPYAMKYLMALMKFTVPTSLWLISTRVPRQISFLLAGLGQLKFDA